MWNMIYLATGAIFIVLLVVVFFSKEVVPSYENRIFKTILIISLIGYFVEIPLQLFVRTLDISNILIDVFCREYLVLISLWYSVFTMYVFAICLNKEKKNYDSSFKIIRTVILFVQVVVAICLVIAPFTKYYDTEKMFIYGTALDILKLYFAVQMFLYVILLLINHRDLKNKKYLPIYFVLICLVLMTMLNTLDPSILITTMIGTFICYTMFFTIENPDLKMINELELAREQAEKANRAKTDFLSSMSHEIRTPLNAIVGFSDCIADAKNLGEAQENAKDIVNASQTLLEIVNGILDISKIEAGKIEIINTKYNALETFEDLAKLIAPRMKEKGLDFSYKIASDLPETLFGDHANIKKIVTNLLSNACKYTDTGYVHYEVNCINTKDVSKLIISVEDSGRGIRKESVDKMFTKFQRLDEDRNTTIEGTGLGLAITKQLIELMGGRIIVHTVYGQGSKFTVVLNQKITQADVTVKKFKSTLDLNNIRVLIVDDTPLNLKVGCKLLEKYGANHVATCTSGFECLDRINRGEVYDVILLDDMMPKMSGVETLKKLKENPNFKIPTVALTANAITGMKEKYLSDGFDDYLAKPIDQTQLIQVFNQILGRSATEDINVSEVQRQFNNENIRNDEIPNVIAQEKAERERDENNHSIIPVEDNIEELLGNQLDMNYKEELLKPIVVDHIEDIEILDDNSETSQSSEQTQIVSPVPLVHNAINLYDKEYLESNGVDVDHALELLGDMNMYNMTISDFISGVEDKWNKIVEYKNSNNMADYAIVVHSLKSDCKYLGFMKLELIV